MITRFTIAVAALLLAPTVALAFSGADLDKLSISQQLQVLQQKVGCGEGGDVSSLEELTDVVRHLNSRYVGVDNYGEFSDEELRLITRLTHLDACAAYHTNDKGYYLDGCRIAFRLSKHIAPADGLDATVVCYDKHPNYTPAERAEILRLAATAATAVAEKAAQSNDPRRHYFQFMRGRYEYLTGIDKQGGLRLMYEAAQTEYQEKGIDKFDDEMAKLLGLLNNEAIYSKDVLMLRFVRELEADLAERRPLLARQLSIDDPRVHREKASRIIESWATGGATPVTQTVAPTPAKSAAQLNEQQPQPSQSEAQESGGDVAATAEPGETPVSVTPWGLATVMLFLLAAVGLGTWLLWHRKGGSG